MSEFGGGASRFGSLFSVVVHTNFTFSERKVSMCRQLVYLCCIVLMLAAGGAASAEPLQQDFGPDGIVSVEAEHYDNKTVGDNGDEWIEVGPMGGFTGTAGMQAQPDNNTGSRDTNYAARSPRLDYEINFVTTGTHYVWILAFGDDGNSDSCHAGLDGQEISTADRMSGWNVNYRWRNTTSDGPVATIEVTTAGQHTFNIWMREDGLIVDKIVLTTNPNFSLTGTEAGPPESSRSPIVNALDPTPADGALHEDTWVSLGWTPAKSAASHDVYLGESFADVNDGTGGTFRGITTSAFFLVGVGTPGDPYPTGLVPGTTYYWRIDEVEADGVTRHRGIVWSFFVPPRKAYKPSPADGTRYLDPDVKLSWSPALAAKLHFVYFGDKFDDVNNATGATGQIATTYTPAGPLAHNKTYYWRVDESDGAAVHKGDVWSFRTIVDIPITDPTLVGWWKFETGDTMLLDWSGHGNHGTIVGNVQWASTLFNLGLEFLGDNEGYVELPPTMVTTGKGSVLMWINTSQTDDEGMLWYGTQTAGDGYGGENEIHINVDDPGQLDFFLEEDGSGSDITIDGPQIAGLGWTHVAATWDLADGCRLYVNGSEVGYAAHNTNVKALTVVRLGYSYGGSSWYEGMMDDVRLFDHAVTADQVKEIMSKGEDPLKAGSANPSSGAQVAVNMAIPLLWSAGQNAAQHDVYFGLDKNAVEVANASDTTGVYRGRQAGTSYSPPEGVTWSGGPYYWRIDEVNKDGTITAGTVWNFSTTDYLLVDDFESYNDVATGKPGSHLVYETWLDGYGTTTNGSTIGYPQGASMESSIVYGGLQSVPLAYNNTTTSSSEVSVNPASIPIGRNWTSGSPAALVLWFHGGPTNATTERMYVKINGVKVTYPGPAVDIARLRWSQWNIDLAALGVNLANVTQFAIGFERTGATGGAGTVLIDEIRLYQSAPPIVLASEEIWIEAESGSITDPMKIYDDPLASGGKCIGTDIGLGNASAAPPPDGVATYTFTVKGGVYKISGRVIIPDGDSFWVRIQGASIPATTELDPSGWVRWSDPPNGLNWHWEDVFSGDNVGGDDPTVLFTLPAGTHTLEIARREDGALLDVFVNSKVD